MEENDEVHLLLKRMRRFLHNAMRGQMTEAITPFHDDVADVLRKHFADTQDDGPPTPVKIYAWTTIHVLNGRQVRQFISQIEAQRLSYQGAPLRLVENDGTTPDHCMILEPTPFTKARLPADAFDGSIEHDPWKD